MPKTYFKSDHFNGGGSVPTIGFGLLYALVIVRLARRDLVWINVTANPTAEWITRQITEAFPWDDAPRYLIRDRDRIYGAAVLRRLRAMGIRGQAHRPAFALAERRRREADRIDPSRVHRPCRRFGRRALAARPAMIRRYYNQSRTHRSLNKESPLHWPIENFGAIISRRFSRTSSPISPNLNF